MYNSCMRITTLFIAALFMGMPLFLSPYAAFLILDRDNVKEESKLSLIFVGDIMLDRGVEAYIMREGKGDWRFPFLHVKDELQEADIVFGNLEGPVSDKGIDEQALYSFRMNPAVAPALKEAGFRVVSLANNHAMDWGEEALEDTRRRLHAAGVQYAPAIVEARGRQIGLLAFDDVSPPGIEIAAVENAVRLMSRKVDILAVSFHFGEEYQEMPLERQRMLARGAIDAGAKVVVGHHPHVVQPIEEYRGGVIAYSLGNFVFDQYFSEETMRGLMLNVQFEGDEIAAIAPILVKLNEFYQPMIE